MASLLQFCILQYDFNCQIQASATSKSISSKQKYINFIIHFLILTPI